eukprot:scaffold294_cov221-Amphora_coffeaeformis.AAC.23
MKDLAVARNQKGPRRCFPTTVTADDNPHGPCTERAADGHPLDIRLSQPKGTKSLFLPKTVATTNKVF